jgi:hypothetical protein
MEIILRILMIGVGATLVMDAWLLLLKKTGQPTMNFALFGRWVGHLTHGAWSHPGIAKSPPITGEAALGWSAHYAIGLVFAAALLLIAGPDWARAPTFLPALITGLITVLAPLLILQPAMGAGIASSKTPTPMLNCMRSIVTHSVFGVGLYLAALLSARIAPHL